MNITSDGASWVSDMTIGIGPCRHTDRDKCEAKLHGYQGPCGPECKDHDHKEHHHLVIRAAKLSEKGEGAPAEVSIAASENGGTPQVIKWAQLNLKADQTRERLAKRLSERWPGPDWDILLEQFCYRVLVELRRGEPVEEIVAGEGYEGQPPSFLLSPIILENDPTMLYARGGVGKSWAALVLALTLQLPWRNNPLNLRPPDHVTNVLYLDYEDSKRTFQNRLAKLAIGCGVGMGVVQYRRCSQPFADEVDTIATICKDRQVGCIIIDSVGMATSDSMELADKRSASTLARACRFVNLPTVWVHHTRKGGVMPGEERSSFGSVYFENEARSVFYLEAEEGGDGDTIDLVWNHKKINNGRRLQPFAWRFTFDDERRTVTPSLVDVATLESARKNLPLYAQVWAMLDAPMTVKAIAEELDHKEGAIRSLLNKYRSKKFMAVGDLWCRVSRETAP